MPYLFRFYLSDMILISDLIQKTCAGDILIADSNPDLISPPAIIWATIRPCTHGAIHRKSLSQVSHVEHIVRELHRLLLSSRDDSPNTTNPAPSCTEAGAQVVHQNDKCYLETLTGSSLRNSGQQGLHKVARLAIAWCNRGVQVLDTPMRSANVIHPLRTAQLAPRDIHRLIHRSECRSAGEMSPTRPSPRSLQAFIERQTCPSS
jgi:hypothetical protein